MGRHARKEVYTQYTYAFDSWLKSVEGEIIDLSLETVQREITYYALFTEMVNEYTKAFINNETRVEYQVAYDFVPECKEW